MATKKANQRFHAKVRAAERYGLHLTRRDLDALVSKIQSGDGEFLGRDSLRTSEWLVMHGQQACRVIYDTKRKTIVTFLPLAQAI